MTISPRIPIVVIERCKTGDEKAFAEIVTHYQKKVFNLSYRMLGNLEEAKDIAQEVFISVFKSIKKLKEEQRGLLVLRDLQGFSYEEIGDMLGLPEGTIKSKLHRARMDLKEVLERSAH